MIRIRTKDSIGNTRYLFQAKDGSWKCASQAGTPLAFSYLTKDAMVLRFALEDAGDDAEAALAAVKAHAEYTKTAELVLS